MPSSRLKLLLYRSCGFYIGKNVYIAEHLLITENLEALGNVVIGDRVSIAPNVTLVTSSHPNNSRIYRHAPVKEGKVIIGDDAWIGTGSIILPCVKIGESSIVGAGSVVTRDVPPLSIVAGNPARVIRLLDMGEHDLKKRAVLIE